MKNILVSIIIPAYNCEKHIDNTLKTVKNQTYPKELLEVIIINDGSTDSTSQILKKYEGEFTIIHTKNEGVSAARNIGLRYAMGTYIQYLDSDDLLMPEKIKTQVTALIEQDGDIAYGNWNRFKEIDDELIDMGQIEQKIIGELDVALLTYFWSPPAALLYSKRIVEKIGPWKQWLPIIQDARYILDAAILGGKFVHTNFLAAQYRTNENSLSNSSKKLFIADCFNNGASIYKLWTLQQKLSGCKRNSLIAVLSGTLAGLIEDNPSKFHLCCKYLNALNADHHIYSKPLKRYICKLLGIKKTEQILHYYRKFK